MATKHEAMKGLGVGMTIPMAMFFAGSESGSFWLLFIGLFAPVFLIASFVLLFVATYMDEGPARRVTVLFATFALGWPIGTWSSFAIYGSLAE